MQKERVSVQKQTSFWDYRLTYAPFRFLEDPSVQPFHLAPNTPESGDIGELHYHDGLELGLCLSGSGVFIIDGDPLPFSAPCATESFRAVMPANECCCRHSAGPRFCRIEVNCFLHIRRIV